MEASPEIFGSMTSRVPDDEYNRELLANVHPSGWANPEPAPRYNIVVIGAGTAGLVTAAGAAGLGARVALVERQFLGGDCLNFGCVPSKSIIRSSRICAEIRDAREFGIGITDGGLADFPAVMRRMRRLRAGISRHDSAERFRSLGVDVFLGEGRFMGPDSVDVGGKTLRFRKAVIATGARAARPEIEGLADAGFLTNETVFSLTELPRRVLVIGAGPVGCELAQAFRRFGSETTIVQKASRLLAREDPEASVILQESFERDGIWIRLNADVIGITSTGDGKRVLLRTNGKEEVVAVDEILIGAGRRPNVEGLNLEAAKVEYDEKNGVKVNDHLQTTNPDIFAAGDICLDYKFTHTADASARIAIRNALFMGRQRFSALAVPWCTYTDPEIAHVGMYEHEARSKGMEVQTFSRQMKDVDRAVTDGDEKGFVRIHVLKGTDRILGATVVARHAGEMINEISLAIAGNIGLGAISGVIHSYPTQSEAIRQVADAYNRTRLTPFVRKLFSYWLEWQR
jgi:pyruvate/2-oxoglutarate dehydrogenase complex dihydrolipoamide dehydrogenase (E3) component